MINEVTNSTTLMEFEIAENPNESVNYKRSKSKHFYKWVVFAPLGILLISSGLCIFADAFEMKIHEAQFINWFLWGGLGLVLINSGLFVFGEAIKSKTMLELRKKRRISR